MLTKKINHKQRRLIFVAVIFLISICSVIFIILNFRENIVFFYSPSEINQIKSKKTAIRVGGMIKENSIVKIDALNTFFIITDYENQIQVNYKGILPDLFRDNQGVVAKGNYNIQENKFYSEELLVKHDENYMPPEVARDLKMKMPKK